MRKVIAPYVVSLVLLARSPQLPLSRAHYFAQAIVKVAEAEEHATQDDNFDDIAALLVNGERESSWRYDVERCRILGLGGLGTYGVGSLWEPTFPGGTCGSSEQQAKAALRVLRLGEGTTWRTTFGHYIGARAVGKHPEAIRRTHIFWQVRAMLVCACSELV